MAYRLTSAQRCILADDVRSAVAGWLLTDPEIGSQARRLEHMSTTITGFRFSRFAQMAIAEFGAACRPRSITAGVVFPLGLAEACALANDLELEMATDDQIYAAGLIAAYSCHGQPQVGSRDWRTHVAVLKVMGLSVDCPPLPRSWRDLVRERLLPFRRAVAAAAATVDLVPAE